ncbi:MAG: hypothetical protein HY288_11265 [Planctomycetia bacterium]|nr:hypothetical protein [Planctomycetia bacterium]
MCKLSKFVASFFAVLLMATSAHAAEWGTLTGRIVVDGKPPKESPIDTAGKDPQACTKEKLVDEGLLVDAKGGLANAVIMLKTKNPAVNPELMTNATGNVDLDNKNCRFEPHVQVVLLTQTLLLKNSDPVSHNSKVDPLNTPGINPILPVNGEPVQFKFNSEEGIPVKVGCNIHTWMGAYLVVRKDPYAAVTDRTGAFTLKDLPAGTELEFLFWAENPGYLKNATFKGGKADARGRFKYKIKPGTNDLGDIKVSGSIFKK